MQKGGWGLGEPRVEIVDRRAETEDGQRMDRRRLSEGSLVKSG
jgi:hypothetical protein